MESLAWCPNGMSWVWELDHTNPEQGFSRQFLVEWKRKETIPVQVIVLGKARMFGLA